ncbi:uncharacterized protein SPSK_04451 [Sporothrix schenckii 1099-18]|uniref:Uncharacterized protein n=2 Tax=Sporothrix schenckii TaxID=29908 RepID=U7PLI9_SPOS1|nr:uncharacterized protein SPSK_04451 [Sporothrix schenckii 1099-18]ERS95811.1 hypothetical protein HMPREF1624_07887 [Sporothrix schenckii ATCC 58251]KJR83834.1 hypothetical protein SPSK_04451 [Sporothrix schenckii 1099-18]
MVDAVPVSVFSASLSASSSAPASTSAFFAVPATVTAGVPSTATIAAGTLRGSGNSDTSAVRALEVFLAVVGRDTTSVSNATSECYLTQNRPLCDIPGITVYSDRIQFADVHVPFTVPPSVDGSGRRFALRMQVLQADGSVFGGASSAPLSPAFVLANATGRSQLFSTVFAPGAYVPCGSLSCVDNCFSRLFGESTNLTSESASTAACANACAGIEGVDGVVAIPSDWLVVAASASSASVPLQVLSTVPAGTATGCFVSGTTSASTSTSASASAGTSKSKSQGAWALWSLAVAGMLLAVLT